MRTNLKLLKPPYISARKLGWRTCYIAIALWFFSTVLDKRQAAVGFTSMLIVGDKAYQQSTPDFKSTYPRIFENSAGYDAQYYAQIALDPSLRTPELATAVDSLQYRARRILMPATAWVLGTGDPKRIITLYPLINPACWLISALLLLHWLPPTCIQNFIRWSGILLGWGWISSVERSLTDGPAATLTLLALFLLSRNKPIKGAIAIAASVLTKETSLLAGLSLAPDNWKTPKGFARFALLGVLVLAPVLLWWLYLHSVTPPQKSFVFGSSNFTYPLQGLVQQFQDLLAKRSQQVLFRFSVHLLSFVALTLQITFFILKPNWKNPIWRACFPFALMSLFLGTAVWEGAPGAAPRVLILLHIGFNLIVPRSKAWLPLLVLANVSVLDFPSLMRPPELSPRSERFIMNNQLVTTRGHIESDALSISFLEGWHLLESSPENVWRWTHGQSDIQIHNTSDNPIFASLSLKMGAALDRDCTVLWNAQPINTFAQSPSIMNYPIGTVRIDPGSNLLTLASNTPDLLAGPQDTRLIGACLFQITFDRAADQNQ